MKTEFKYAFIGSAVTLAIVLSVYLIMVTPAFKTINENKEALNTQLKDKDKMVEIGLIKLTGPDNMIKARKYDQLGASKAAIAICEQLKKLNTKDSEVLIFEAELYIKEKEYDRAKKNLITALKAENTNTWALRTMGDLLRHSGANKEAIKYYNKVMELDNSKERADTACVLVSLSKLYESENNYVKALECVDKAKSMNKNTPYDEEKYEELKMKAAQ